MSDTQSSQNVTIVMASRGEGGQRVITTDANFPNVVSQATQQTVKDAVWEELISSPGWKTIRTEVTKTNGHYDMASTQWK